MTKIETQRLTESERRGCAETYAEVERLIYDICWTFASQYGGSVEELIADANTHFMRAYMAKTFDSKKSKFSTWVHTVIWRGLLSEHARPRMRRVQIITKDDLTGVVQDEELTIESLSEDISEDARMVMELALTTPDELYDVVVARGGAPRNFRSAIRDYLYGLSWTAERISESFEEIRNALK